MGRSVSSGYIDQRMRVDSYAGVGIPITLELGFEPKCMEIIVESTGERIIKTRGHASSKCILNKLIGVNKYLKAYILTTGGIEFHEDFIVIGNSEYINAEGETYHYIIWG